MPTRSDGQRTTEISEQPELLSVLYDIKDMLTQLSDTGPHAAAASIPVAFPVDQDLCVNVKNQPIVDLDSSYLSAFGTLETAELTPLVQLDWIYGINTQTGSTTGTTGTVATATTSSGRLALTCGTDNNGQAVFTSRRTAKYRPGQGITARFTTIFTNNLSGNTQIAGIGNAVDGYFVGYNGTSFGFLLRTNSVDTWIPQISWNQDGCDCHDKFKIDTTKGNVWQIKYPYLGYGDIKFYVQNPATSRWILCHIIKYANAYTALQVTNPNLNFYAQNINSGNTTSTIMYVGSVGVFLSGTRSFIGSPKWAIDSIKTNISTTETNVITLKNCTTYNGVTNRSLIRLHSLSVSNQTNNNLCRIRFRINATVTDPGGGSAVAFTTINGTTANAGVTITAGNSGTSYDVNGTTTSAGTYIYNVNCGPNSNTIIDLTPFDIFVAPTELLTISAVNTVSSDVAISINWTEDI